MFRNTLIILILLMVIYIYLFIKRSTKNKKRHLTDEYPLGHFSKIDSSNYFLYPKLLTSTSPIRFTLYEGDSVYIPCKWWHWIKSYKSIAVNYWILKGSIGWEEKPKILKTGIKYDEFISAFKKYSGSVHVWDNNTDNIETKQEKSLYCEKDRNYIITLPGYSDKNGIKNRLNEELFNNLKQYIDIPNFLLDFSIEKNIWIATGYNDSGLHYDDYGGILTVIKGKKKITLYPPKDSIHLCPFDIKPYWTVSEPVKFEYNLYKYISTFDNNINYSSGRLLYESMKCVNNKNMLRVVSELCNSIGVNKTIWGFKKKGDEIRWEIYFYHINMINSYEANSLKNICFKEVPLLEKFNNELVKLDNTVVHSFDLYDTEKVLGDDIHIYYKSSDFTIPFFGYGECVSQTKGTSKESIYVIDSYYGFIFNYYSHLKYLKLEDATGFENFLTNFTCKDIAIMNKFDGNIFIMYYGISVISFIDFLKKFDYPKYFIEHVVNNKHRYKYIRHEIAIIYDIKTKLPIRSGLYGIV